MKYLIALFLYVGYYKYSNRPPRLTAEEVAGSPILLAMKYMQEQETPQTRRAFYEALMSSELRGEGKISVGMVKSISIPVSWVPMTECRHRAALFTDEKSMKRDGKNPEQGFAQTGVDVFSVMRVTGLSLDCVDLNPSGPGRLTLNCKELEAMSVG